MAGITERIVVTPAVLAELRHVFTTFDKDGSGTIDRWELTDALKALGRTPNDDSVVDAMLLEVDKDGSGLIEFDEFVALVVKASQGTGGVTDADKLDAFVALGGNADKSGHVLAHKLRELVESFGLLLDVEALIKEADTDGSGEIDFDEFAAMLTVSSDADNVAPPRLHFR